MAKSKNRLSSDFILKTNEIIEKSGLNSESAKLMEIFAEILETSNEKVIDEMNVLYDSIFESNTHDIESGYKTLANNIEIICNNYINALSDDVISTGDKSIDDSIKATAKLNIQSDIQHAIKKEFSIFERTINSESIKNARLKNPQSEKAILNKKVELENREKSGVIYNQISSILSGLEDATEKNKYYNQELIKKLDKILDITQEASLNLFDIKRTTEETRENTVGIGMNTVKIGRNTDEIISGNNSLDYKIDKVRHGVQEIKNKGTRSLI